MSVLVLHKIDNDAEVHLAGRAPGRRSRYRADITIGAPSPWLR